MASTSVLEKDRLTCRWFLKCRRPAVTTKSHPLLGEVPICRECDEKIKRLEKREESR
jgi:hypothetical protein